MSYQPHPKCILQSKKCSEGSKLTREHAVPLWVPSTYPVLEDDLHIRRGIGGNIRFIKPAGNNSLIVGSVCEKCHQLLNELIEVPAQPILKDIYDRKRNPHDLSEEERSIVSKWLLKTALFILLASPKGPRANNNLLWKALWNFQSIRNFCGFGRHHFRE